MSKKRELAKQKTETRIVFAEAGTSGLKEYSGFVSEAYNSELYWPTVQPLYSRLMRSMPEMVMVGRTFVSWGRNISPLIELPDDATDDDKRYQEFIYSDMENMDGGFGGFLETNLEKTPFYGWGYWTAVMSRRDPNWKPPEGDEWRSEADDGLIGIRRLAWRDPSTFYGWKFDDNKKLLGLNQQDYPKSPVYLPLSDSLHLKFGNSHNPEGMSPLEAVWRLERLRYGLEVVQGIGYEHAAGYLNVQKTSDGTLTAGDKSSVREAAKAILTAQEGNYALWPYGIEGSVIDVPFSAAPSLLEAIRHYSILSLSVYAMQWMALNTMTGTGSFAAADDSSSMGVFTFNAMLDGFAAQYDQQIGRRLWELNKASFPNATKRPVIKFSHINKSVALGEMGSFLQQMNGIMPLGDDDMKAIRKRSGFLSESLPEVDPEEEAAKAEEKARAQIEKDAMETKDVIEQSLKFASRSHANR